MKESKRWLSLLLVFAMLMSVVSGLSLTAFAEDGNTLTISAQKNAAVDVSKAQTVDVEVSASNNTGFMQGDFEVEFDTTALELTSVTLKTEALKAGSHNLAKGIVAFETDGDAVYSENGVFLVLTFKVLDAAQDQTYPITLKERNGFSTLNGMIPVDVATNYESGAVTITGATPAAPCVSVKSGAKPTEKLTTGAQNKTYLSDLFADEKGHTMTYSYKEVNGKNLTDQTKIATDAKGAYFNLSVREAGTYEVMLTATCSDGKTAQHTITYTVEKAPEGSDEQYGYNETPADSVTVYVTISSDGVPLVGNDDEETVLSHLAVTVPYFDLEEAGLADFYRYHTDGGKGSYVDNDIVKRPTALHLYLYMLGVYYMHKDPDQLHDWIGEVKGAAGGHGVYNMMNGDPAYDDTLSVLNITGSPTSMYMQQFWGHDENLMYYRNHVYPLMGPGWGSTADYILLSDGDTIDLAMFGNWDFWTKGAFAAFDQDDYTVQPGNALNFSTVKYDTRSVAQGGGETFQPITGLTVKVYDENWKELDTVEATAADSNDYTYTFTKAGTYYLMALDPNAGDTGADSAACYAPATAKVTVGGGSKPFDPDEYYKDYDFSKITLDENGTDYVYNIAESTINVSHFSNPGDKKLYTVTVPEGTQTVYVTYPADFDQTIMDYCALFDDDGNVSWNYYAGSDYEYKVTRNDDGTTTIALPAAFLLENNLSIAAENNDNYDYFNCFKFVVGENKKPGGDDSAAVTGVKLDKETLTVARRATQQLTATVSPENATNTKVTWSTSNSKVATVDRNGLVTGVTAGEATITVTTKDGGFKAECKVTVTDENKPPVNEDDGYYEISTAAQLKWFADEVNDGNPTFNARLMNDIDLSSVCSAANGSWTPIGNHQEYQKYSGTFDGQAHTIKNLYINEEMADVASGNSYYRALFGNCESATIKNLTVTGEVTSNSRYVAGIVGRAWTTASSAAPVVIENCHNEVNVTSECNDRPAGTGGITADAGNGTKITNCSNSGKIVGRGGRTGGITGGVSNDAVIDGCYNSGYVYNNRGYNSDQLGTGGIAGGISTATIQNCYNTGKVEYYYKTQAHEQGVGGIAGYLEKGSAVISNSYNYGELVLDDVTATKGTRGGVLGGIGSGASYTLTNCFFAADENGRFGDQNTYGAKAVAAERLGTAELVSSLGSRWKVSCPYAVLDWQTAKAHTEPDSVTGECTNCGAQLTGGNHAPTLKEGIDETAAATTDTRTAYTLDLSTIFTDADEGDTLTYRVSVDNGADEAVADGKFSKQYEEVGTHTLVFTANDSKSDSLVSYRVTLTVTWPTPKQDESGVYLISAVDEMLWFRDAVNGGSTGISAKLMANLDLTVLGNWTPIAGTTSTKFAGTFDGNQQTLKLHYDMNTSGKPYFGFFKYVDNDGTVKNLKLDYDKLSTLSSNHLGGVVDFNAGTISGCTVTVGEFYTNKDYAGGICASNSGTIENCTVTATKMSLGGCGGGIVGSNAGKVLNCTMNGEIVKAGKNSGGIVGYHKGEVSGCVNNANIAVSCTSPECNAGGIAGQADNGSKVTNCVNKGTVSSTKGYIGGIVGNLSSSVTNCGNEGAVNGGATNIGGVAGNMTGGSSIKGCYNKAAVNSTYANGEDAKVGGVAGNAYSSITIENCYNTGDVSVVKGKWVGGLLGRGSNNTSTRLTNCYNTGKVTNDASMASYTKPFYCNAALVTNCYNLNEEQPGVTKVTEEQLRFLAETLGEAFEESCNEFPLLKWQNAAKAHTEPNASGKCDNCGKQLLDPNHAPKRKDGVEATAAATTDTKTAYTLDLNTIFTDEDNDTLTYYVSVDGGEKAAVSGSAYSVTYDAVGAHTLVFTANDGKADSLDTYTVTLTVEMAAPAKDENGSYLIYTLDELTWFVNKVKSGDKTASAKLMANIDAGSIKNWEPIKSFGGTFDGNGKVLSGINISYTSGSHMDMGVFSEITAGGTVKNLTVRYTSAVRTYSSRLGGIAGNNAGTISNCTVQSTAVFGGRKDSIVGGICGKNTGTIENCTVAMLNKLQGTDSIGGICGYSEGSIKNCTVSGEISVDGLKTGGIVGELAGDGSTVTGCTNKAKVSNSNNNTANCVGGIAGTVTKNSTITKCANTADITSGGGKMGGIAGNMQKGSVSECYNTGAITSTYPNNSTLYVAGLIGFGYGSVVTTDSYNTGAVTVATGKNVAGLIGGARYKSTTITNCYNAGTVTNTKGSEASPAFGGTLIQATNCYALNGTQTGVTQLTEAELKQAADKLGDKFDDSCNEFPPLKWQNAAKAHTIVESGATEATCTEPAHTASKVCSVCGKVVEAGQPVGNPLGHDYKASYTWTETADGYSCTAEAVCSHDASHTLSENATVTSTSKDATCETAGEVVYTAAFTNEAFETQTKTITGTVLGHDYGTPSYTWTETSDGYSCTAEAVCSHDASHKLTETATVTSKTTPATCDAAGKTVYTATFTNAKFEAQTKTITLNALGHAYGSAVYAWSSDHKSCTATRSCTRTGCTHKQTANATVTETITKKPTYTETGSADYTAVFTEDWAQNQVLTGVTLPKLTQPVTPVTPAKPVKPDTGKTDTVKLPFSDVTRTDWFFAAVKGAYEKGLMSGTSATKFSPSDDTTRGMVVTILARLDGVKTAGSNPWYAAGRTWAMTNGISDGTNMDGSVTREQLAAILYRYAVMKGYDVRVSASLSHYSDADKVSDWAVTAMHWAVGAGLINGRSANTLAPQGTAMRAEVAAILLRFVSLYEK